MADGPALSERMLVLRGKGPVNRIAHLRLGALLGVGFGAWNLLVTWFNPLADDTPRALLRFYGAMFVAWSIASFAAARRTGRIVDGIKAGATVAFATFVVFDFLNLVRVNVFLDTIRHRLDWQTLIVRFQASGLRNLRVFANYEYLTGAPAKIFVATVIGTIVGLVGAALGVLMRREPRQLTQG